MKRRRTTSVRVLTRPCIGLVLNGAVFKSSERGELYACTVHVAIVCFVPMKRNAEGLRPSCAPRTLTCTGLVLHGVVIKSSEREDLRACIHSHGTFVSSFLVLGHI